MRTTPAALEVVRAAILWWRSHRPEGWTQDQHLAAPGINAIDRPSARALAEAVGALLREQGEDGA